MAIAVAEVDHGNVAMTKTASQSLAEINLVRYLDFMRELAITGSSVPYSALAISSLSSVLCLTKAEDQHIRFLSHCLKHVAGFPEEVGNVDGGQRIGAFDHQPLAGRHPG